MLAGNLAKNKYSCSMRDQLPILGAVKGLLFGTPIHALQQAHKIHLASYTHSQFQDMDHFAATVHCHHLIQTLQLAETVLLQDLPLWEVGMNGVSVSWLQGYLQDAELAKSWEEHSVRVVSAYRAHQLTPVASQTVSNTNSMVQLVQQVCPHTHIYTPTHTSARKKTLTCMRTHTHTLTPAHSRVDTN